MRIQLDKDTSGIELGSGYIDRNITMRIQLDKTSGIVPCRQTACVCLTHV